MTSDGSASPAKFAYTTRDQLSSITPHGGSATAIVSHGTGQEDLAAIGTEEVIQNVLGVASTGTGESATYYTRGSEGQLLAKRKSGEKPSETQYYLLDPFGSPAILTSSTGAQVAPASGTYQYDSYGSPVGTGPSTFGYRSGEVLPDGLVHYGERDYDPTVGSWTQQDPISDVTGLTQANRFAFVGNNPLDNADLNGELFGFLNPFNYLKGKLEQIAARYGYSIFRLAEKVDVNCAAAILAAAEHLSLENGAKVISYCGAAVISSLLAD
jgi:RHS repeat-associated protein